ESGGSVPTAVPLMALRVGDRLIVSIPGEMTVGMGRRVRAAVVAAAGAQSGIHAAVISGLANEYLSYFTTPEEYEQQHYEGGSTLYGEYSSNLLIERSAELASRLVTGRPAQPAYAYDPRDGVRMFAPPFPTGSNAASIATQPKPAERVSRALFSWKGGHRGFDRPLDRPFVTVRRMVGGAWRPVADDLGLSILWKVHDGRYTALWQVPLDAVVGSY